jgi:abortive phage resistance protein AbiGi (putative antitoxin)
MSNINGYTSEILYHFVGRANPLDHEQNYIVLSKILAAGCISYSPHSDTEGVGDIGFTLDLDRSLFSQDLIEPTVTCYCEIPYKLLRIHSTKYGLFGLGFEKSLLIQQGARPVFYMPYSRHDRIGLSFHGVNLLRNIERAFTSFGQLVEQISEAKSDRTHYLNKPTVSTDQIIEDMHSMFAKDFLAFVKVFDCTLSDDHPKNYYMEREWRKYQYLRFEPGQVRTIIVAPGFGDRARTDYPMYAEKIAEYQN